MSGLSDADQAVMISALEDAAAYRREAGDWCGDCNKQPEGLECADHDSDGAVARAYAELAGRMEGRGREALDGPGQFLAGQEAADRAVTAQADAGMTPGRIDASAEEALAGRFDSPAADSDAFWSGYDQAAAVLTADLRDMEMEAGG